MKLEHVRVATTYIKCVYIGTIGPSLFAVDGCKIYTVAGVCGCPRYFLGRECLRRLVPASLRHLNGMKMS
jgi:hypothetical protein